MSERNRKNDISISKTLSWLLRHSAVKEKLPITSDGFVNVQILLQHKSLRGKCCVDDIKRVVANNDKQRFTLRFSGDILEIRANQGHSINVVDSLELTPITSTKDVDNIIHGTFFKNWDCIKTHGLSRMKRLHIHFASGLPSDKQVISGMRKSCDLYIYINAESVLNVGIKLYKSSNGVILSPGDEQGSIKTKHFLKVIDRSGKNLVVA